jgi:hypothetical protein
VTEGAGVRGAVRAAGSGVRGWRCLVEQKGACILAVSVVVARALARSPVYTRTRITKVFLSFSRM